MSSMAKRPPAAGRDPAAGSGTTSPSRPPRATTPSSAVTGTAGTSSANGIARTRSVRSSTPVSARVAAHQRRDSAFGNGVRGSSAAAEAEREREDAARAETIALLDDLKERLAKAEGASETYKKSTEVLQVRLDEALVEQARLEEKCHEYEEQVETLKNERREASRQMREMEAIYEAERSAMTKEKEDMANREEEMQTIIQRLKDSLSQRNANGDDDIRPSRHSQNNSPSIDNGSFAPPSSISRSDSRNNSKLLLQKDKLIESLRLELAEAQIKLVESENQGGGRLHEVERLLMEARMANARLVEDNESYQLLLQERTLKGDFATSDFSYLGGVSPRRDGGSSSNQDALNALEGRTGSAGNDVAGGTSLADELSEAVEGETDTADVRRLEAELRTAKDQNKALTLYINKIIERLLQHQEFEHILDQSSDPLKTSPNVNKDLPAPPGAKQQPQATGPSLLQRAKSIAAGAGKPRPRPMSSMPSATSSNTTTAGGPSALNNPDTAPSIPIGLTRSTSFRRGRPMSEQFTGSIGTGGSGLVNAMYKGPNGDNGQFSPTLRSAQTFFSGQQQTGGHRVSSGGATPQASSGNFPGETSSTSGESAGDVATPPSMSPPRSERDSKEKGATLAGNKPRPLRLVQENAVPAAENKRASWIGWAWGSGSGGGKEGGPGSGKDDVIRE